MADKKPFSRRSFLRLGAATAAVGAVATTAPAPVQAGLRQSHFEVVDPARQMATLFDLSKCIGCGKCVDACRDFNAEFFPRPSGDVPPAFPAKRVTIEDWRGKEWVRDRLTPYNWLYIQRATVVHEGRTHVIHAPRRCMHCDNPPCANLCPFGSARKTASGTVLIDENTCFGGAKCRKVCPWDVPQRQSGLGLYMHILPRYAGNGVMYKCRRCYSQMADGHLPACITQCPMHVQTIGPRKEIVAAAHKLAEQTGGYIYGETENGGTSTLYVSPVPFDKLNAALNDANATGKGRPDFAPHDEPFEDEAGLAVATFAAPVLGAAAAVAAAAIRKADNPTPSSSKTDHREDDHA